MSGKTVNVELLAELFQNLVNQGVTWKSVTYVGIMTVKFPQEARECFCAEGVDLSGQAYASVRPIDGNDIVTVKRPKLMKPREDK